MSSSAKTQPKSFHAPSWDGDAHTPIVDGKYEDPTTGEVKFATGEAYGGPPEVDIVVFSVHAETAGCVQRASRPFKMKHILSHIGKVISDYDLEIDSLTATPYAIRVVLAHELTTEDFGTIANEMVNGLWPRE